MPRRVALALLLVGMAGGASWWLCRPPSSDCPPPPVGAGSRPGGFDPRYPHHPSELLVGYSPPLAPSDERDREAERARLFRRLSLSKDELSASLRIYRVTLESGSGANALADPVAALQARADLFRYVEPNACVYLEQTPSPSPDPKRPDQWALDEIEAEDAWQTEGGCDDVSVAGSASGRATHR